MDDRREFIKKTATAAWLMTTTGLPAIAATGAATPAAPLPDGSAPTGPWYRTVTRWGQVNITEKDPQQYDISWWRNYWRRTGTRGIIANAGGIVAYYPTKISLHRKAEYLGNSDLFGDLCHAAHADGLAVFARMDSNRAHEDFFQAHPDWFAVDKNGSPYKAADLYIACVNSPYYGEHLPSILREIATLYHPEGFTDNSWSGLGRDSICYCGYCRKGFRDAAGFDLPTGANWADKAYKAWIRWNYNRRLELWELNNQTTKAAGGPDCIWSGMNSGSVSAQSRSFRDFKEIAGRAEIIMLDDQARTDTGGFQHNGEAGKLIHGILGWEKLIPESMAMYQAHKPWFRVASKPEPEARLWMAEGLAGGIQLWWHMVGAYHEDRRMYHNPEAMYSWEKTNERFLLDRRPVATVGVVWSQENMDLYGRENPEERVELPWRGITSALIRARIPYLPVHADYIDRDAGELAVLLLPDLAVLSDTQTAAIRRFVDRGGSLVATGNTGLLDHEGEPRPDFALANLFGAHLPAPRDIFARPALEKFAGEAWHTYLRLSPALRRQVDGPTRGDEPPVTGNRHPILKGFEETDILPFGGLLEPLHTDDGCTIPMTFIPQFPVYPPEKAWMRIPATDIPGLILREEKKARIAYLPADIDRQYGRSNLPDHGSLLRNIIVWAAHGRLPLTIEGAGLIDTHLYHQSGRLVLHLVNLTNENTWRQPLDELIPVGPLKIKVKLPADVGGQRLHSLVSGLPVRGTLSAGWCQFEVTSILDHQVIVIA